MAEISQLPVEGVAIFPNRPTEPADLAFFRMKEAGETAQQSGLARAIGPQQLQCLPGWQRETQPAQQMPVAAPQMQVANFEHDVPSSVHGADGGNRTHTPLREADFKSAASTSSATSAPERCFRPNVNLNRFSSIQCSFRDLRRSPCTTISVHATDTDPLPAAAFPCAPGPCRPT